MSLWVDFAHSAHNELFSGLLGFFPDPLLVGLSQFDHFFHFLLVFLLLIVEVVHFQTVEPLLFVEIQKHLLLVVIFPVVDRQSVIVLVESMSQSLSHSKGSSAANPGKARKERGCVYLERRLMEKPDV